jgi:thymidylate synthase (FAD)
MSFLIGAKQENEMASASLAGWTVAPIVPNQPAAMEDAIVYFARVSNPTAQMENLSGDKLLKYLIRHKHWSPFEMVNVVLEIETSRDISRQMLRHRSFSAQEFSQRYSATETLADAREVRLQDYTNRQNSLAANDSELKAWWEGAQKELCRHVFRLYDQALKRDIAKEVARCILPEGLTRTKLYVNGTMRSWIHYVELRTHKDTQKEHRQLAVKCATAISNVFPYINQFVQGD